MKNHIRLRGQTGRAVTAVLLSVFALSLSAAPTKSTQVRQLFSDPPRQYTSAPLWVWNDLLTEEQVRSTMRDLAGQNVKQVFVHPRPGLMTPYLSEDWFRLWKVALDEAEHLDMNVWIYDENSYPSGFAGGWVPELMPESRGRGLRFRQSNEQPTWASNVLAVFMRNGNQFEDVTKQVKAGEKLSGQSYITATVERARNSPWHGGRCYVDLLLPGVTEKFLEVTLGAYEREIGRQFGKRVPGAFTDEPELQPAGGLPWTDDLPEQFEKRWGYSLIANLPSLTQAVGDWRKVRHDYYSTLLRLFIERWGKPYYDYCERRGLEFTGHYWEHEWPNCTMVPDNMAMAAWQQRPGIDILMNQYAENTHAQFGNVRSCREIASVANQLGRGRTLVELYGAGGWDLRFEDMKRIGDWLQVLGVNTLDEHLSYVTIRGARKNDHPQSFSYHEPWWPAYNALAKYFSRLTAALTQGEQINRILVIEPTTTAWMYQGDAGTLNRLGSEFFNLLMSLEAAQIEYDLGCEDIMARHGAVREGRLWVGKRGYDVVVLPPGMENVRSEVADLGEEFLTAGGSIVCLGQPPSRVDGRESDRPQQGAGEPGWITAKPEDAVAILRRWNGEDEFRIRRAEKDGGILFHMRRKLADGDLVFLVNTSITNRSDGIIESNRKGVELWDPATGRISPFTFETTGSGVSARYSLPPCGSMVLFLSNTPVKSAPPESGQTVQIAASGEARTQRIGPNVLKLDYVDVTAGGETLSNAYYYAAAQFAFRKNGMPGNPWDSAVQFKDELISKTFPPESGFTVTYRFNIDCDVPGNLALVVERPDLYSIKCNGVEVSAELDGPSKAAARAQASRQQRRTDGQNQTIGGYTATFKNWWLDKSFGRIPIAHAAKRGENIVTLEAKPFSMWHEIEAAFILGDFRLKPVERGFVIVADAAPETLTTTGLPVPRAGWDKQGHPFYAEGVSYSQSFVLERPSGKYVVSLSDWYGSVAEVRVNGKLAGHIFCAPWECEVTRLLKPGRNEIQVNVIGTLKNTLGPHHGNPPLGSAWPGMFRVGPEQGPPPGSQYHTVSYGLFRPFALKQTSAADR